MSPIYAYICKDCGHEFEEIKSHNERQSAVCPHCTTLTGELLPSAHGGYHMNSGEASTRPRGAGSFRKKACDG